MKNMTVPLALLLSVAALPALQPKPTLDCNHDQGDRNRAHFCEMREQTVSAAGGTISIDARQNGGIASKGWDRADVLVRAQVRAYAASDSEARDLARQVNVQTAGAQIRADGPAHDHERYWSVSYEVFVPARSSANLETVNGGVSISDVSGNLEFKTVNGGVTLRRIGGYVHGRTTNGGVTIELAGDRWDGQGLDVTTTNGGVSLQVPQSFSAQLEAQTSNGGIHTDLPQVQTAAQPGHRSNHLSTALGAGGATLKVTTTNGGVSVKRI